MDAKRAVEVLEEAVALADGYAVELGLVEAQKLAIAALKAQGEPVAWMVRSYEKGVEYIDLHYSEEEAQEAAECMPLSLPKVIALYTAPQPDSQPDSQPAQAVPDGFGKLTRTDLVDYATFVERWVIHHAAKDCVSDSEVVGMIRAHPLTKQITEYVTGTAAPAPGGGV